MTHRYMQRDHSDVRYEWGTSHTSWKWNVWMRHVPHVCFHSPWAAQGEWSCRALRVDVPRMSCRASCEWGLTCLEWGVVVPGMRHVPPHSVVVPWMRHDPGPPRESVNEACPIWDVPHSRHIYSHSRHVQCTSTWMRYVPPHSVVVPWMRHVPSGSCLIQGMSTPHSRHVIPHSRHVNVELSCLE